VRPGNPEIDLTEIPLVCSERKSYCLGNFRGSIEVFRANIRSQHAVERHSAEVDALFQLNLAESPVIWRDYGKR
jgi:hypothetical protein